MNYDFSNFSPGEFEHLIQSLLQKRLGDTSKVFGLGPDGARELTFEGKADYPNSIECLEGYWVVQVKFKIRDFGVEDKFSWLKRSVKEDLEKFLDEKRKLKIPNNYLFYTNIILTPIHKTGGRDKIEEFLVKYKKIIPNIFIFSYDEICRLLDNNRDVRLTYSNLLLTSDLIASLLAKKEIVDDYDDYKKLKKEILVLKKSTSIKDEKIKVLERKLKSFSDTILDLRKLIEVKSNSTLFNKAKWLFLVEKDINAALKLLSEDKLEQEELDIARIRIYKAKLFFAKFDFINCEVQYKKAISIIDNYETNFEYGNYLHSMNYNEKALNYLLKSFSLCEGIQKFHLANDIGSLNAKLGKNQEAEIYYRKALEIISFLDIKKYFKDYVKVMFNFGNHFSRIGQIKMADKIYNYFLENISKFESYFSKSELIIIWGNIGLHYHAIGESIKAIGYIKHGLGLLNIENEINDLPDIQNYCHFNTKLANIYEGLKDYVSAEKHYSNAHKFLKTLAMKIPELCLNTFAELLIDMSILFNLMEDEGVAKISNLITSLKIFEKEWMPVIDFQLGVCYYYLSLSQIKFLKFNEAILNLNKALELITNSKQIDNGADILINEINNELLKIESNSANSKL